MLAACGGPSDSGSTSTAGSTATPSSNPALKVICNVVTKEQAKAASGIDFPQPPAAIAKAHGAECRYDTQKGLVSVEVDDSQGIDAGRVAFSGSGTQTLPGLGDEAIWNPSLYVLWIRKGNAALTIQIVNLNVEKDTIRNNAVALANQILPKLTTS
ncbi:MAG: DUF3558 domain-containing protein [Candidatus Dormibacteraeota bacterium]|nr:DUF3558 domain-containing protein [Candidatus Dormibacteraeota bacterium]